MPQGLNKLKMKQVETTLSSRTRKSNKQLSYIWNCDKGRNGHLPRLADVLRVHCLTARGGGERWTRRDGCALLTSFFLGGGEESVCNWLAKICIGEVQLYAPCFGEQIQLIRAVLLDQTKGHSGPASFVTEWTANASRKRMQAGSGNKNPPGLFLQSEQYQWPTYSEYRGW